MKNIFNTKREKINGRYAYVVFYKKSKTFLFLITKSTSFRKILELQRIFKNKKIIFAYKDTEVEKTMCIIDASNYFKCPGIGGSSDTEIRQYEVFWYQNKQFFKTTIERDGKHPNGNMKYKDVIDCFSADIQLITK